MDKLIVHADPDLADLLPGYLAKRRTELEQLRAAVQARDYDTVRSIGHKLKGNAPAYGFAGMGAIGAELEQAAKVQAADRIEAGAAALADYLERVEVVYT